MLCCPPYLASFVIPIERNLAKKPFPNVLVTHESYAPCLSLSSRISCTQRRDLLTYFVIYPNATLGILWQWLVMAYIGCLNELFINITTIWRPQVHETSHLRKCLGVLYCHRMSIGKFNAGLILKFAALYTRFCCGGVIKFYLKSALTPMLFASDFVFFVGFRILLVRRKYRYCVIFFL